MKRFAVGLLLLLLCTLAFGEDWLPQAVGPFGGLNNTDNSLVIPADRAQDLLNVDITPGGRSVKKRRGYSLFANLTITTSAVHGVHNFYDSSGNSVDLYFNDIYLTASVNGATPVVLFSTGSSGATYQCVDSAGVAYCASSSRSTLIKTEGTTDLQVPTAANGTMVAVTPERLVLAGFLSFPNRVDFSKANDFTTWTVGGNPTDPTNFTITSPGARITHITYAHGRVYAFKDTSFVYILPGITLNDWQVRTVSPNVGTLDNSSVYRDEILYFRGQDGHIYAYDGSNLVKLTRDIDGTVSQSQSRTQNSWTQTTTSDWTSGSYDTSIFVDTHSVSGNLQMTYVDNFSQYRDGTSSTKLVYFAGGVTSGSSNVNVSGGTLNLDVSGAAGSNNVFVCTNEKFNTFSSGTTYYFDVVDIHQDATQTYYLGFYLQDSSGTTQASVGLGADFNLFMYSHNGTGITKYTLFTPVAQSTVGFTPFTFPVTVKFYVSSSGYQLTMNSTVIVSSVTSITAFRPFALFNNLNSVSADYSSIDNFGVVPETFTYTSPVNNATSLTSWDSFAVNNVTNGGSFSYFLRSSTFSFVSTDTTPSWNSITPGSISIATGTYFQVKSSFTLTDINTSGPMALNDFMISWYEGSASDKAYGLYHQDAIWWSVASGTGVTTNNRILRYDLINNFWNVYDIANNGMLIRNNDLYFGGSTSGKIFRFGDSDNDNSSAINAYWKSKDFVGASAFLDEELVNISIAADSIANSSMTVTYTVNGSSETSYTMSLYNANAAFIKNNKNISAGRSGNTFNFKFGNNAADQPFEVFGIQYGIRPKSWIPTQ